MSVVETGINIFEKWDTCTSTLDDDVNNAYQAAWKVYSCIIQTSNGQESKITLGKFANLMSAKYPTEIQSKIMEQVALVGELSTDVSELDQLNKLRMNYFDIEQQVCIEADTSSNKDYRKDHTCEHWEEHNHRGGRCCGESSYPFEIGFNSFLDTIPKTELCLQQLQDSIFTKMSYNLSWALGNAIADICDLSCELMEKSILQPSELQEEDLFSIDFQQIASLLTPSWLPTLVQDDCVTFAMDAFSLNDTIERIKDFEFADVKETQIYDENGEDNGVELEFTMRKFPDSLVHIPVICSAHKEILAFMEIFLYNKKSCNDGS